jgi:hypothetical protein
MTPSRRVPSLVLPILLIAQGCSVHYLQAPDLPPRTALPVVPVARPPGPGEGQVTLEVLGEPARIDRILSRQQGDPASMWSGSPRAGHGLGLSVQTMPLCLAPCTVALPLGDHELQFTALDPASPRISTAFVHVGPDPVFVRHVLGTRRDHTGRLIATVLLGGIGVGAILAGAGLLAVDGQSGTGQVDLGPTGWTTLGVGVLLGGVATWLGLDSATEVQPGATATFSLAPAPTGP